MAANDLTPNGDFLRVEEGKVRMNYALADTMAGFTEEGLQPLSVDFLMEVTRNQFARESLVLARARGTDRVLRDSYEDAMSRDMMIIHADGVVTVTLAVVVLDAMTVWVEGRTVRVGNCPQCWRVGVLGLSCHACNGSVFRPCFFGQERWLGDPTHRAEMMYHALWKMTRNARSYDAYNPDQAPVMVDPVVFMNQLTFAGSEVLGFDDDTFASNVSSALGLSLEAANAIRPGNGNN